MNETERNRKTLEYETFLNERLREDLRKILEQRDTVYEEISEYLQLRATVEKLKGDFTPKSTLKTKVDLGCNFYVQANVPDPSKINVAIGFGFFLEMTHTEAIAFIDKKTKHLQDKANSLSNDAGRVKAHIRLVLEGLRELHSISADPKKPYKDVLS